MRGVIRTEQADFDVTEQLGFELSGDGPHLLVQVEKIGVNTLDAIAAVARYARVKVRDVGYCGLKDRHAVTRQWLSLPLDGDIDWDDFTTEQWRVTEVARNRRKLRIGAHSSNAFVIVVRNLAGTVDDLAERGEHIAQFGVPNYFGPQRFGNQGDNLRRARRWFIDGEPLARRQRRFALSAARSLLFNRVLTARVSDGSWRTMMGGEPAVLDGSNSFFLPPDPTDRELANRLQAGDVHTSGPLWGRGDSPATGDCLALEQRIALDSAWLADGVAGAGPKQERRALRLNVRDFRMHREADTLTLGFALGKGCFATSVLHELLDIDGLTISA